MNAVAFNHTADSTREIRQAVGDGERLPEIYAFSPVEGDLVEGVSDGEESPVGTVHRGEFTGISSATPGSCWIDQKWRVTRSSLRPLATPAASEETYGTQPKDDELPRELPAGTKLVRDYSTGTFEFVSCAKLGAGRKYVGERRSGPNEPSMGVGTYDPSLIDWTSVKRPSSKPVPAAVGPDCASTQASGVGPVRPEPPQPGQSHPSVWGIPRKVPSLVVRHFGPDPYAEQRDRESRGLPFDCGDAFARDTRFDKLRASGDPLDRLAASRISHSRRERDGAEVRQGWDSEDADELYCTS